MKTPESKALSLRVQRGIAVVEFNDPEEKVNTVNSRFSKDFEAMFDYIAKNNDIKGAVLISGKPESFIVGADINELKAAKSASEIEALSRTGHKIMNQLESSAKPVVAAIHGPCMGGGLEVALACHYRIATDSEKTVLALPEVMLGLLPGAGGTQRLPRLVGVKNALDMMLTGKNIRSSKAKKMGLVDAVVPNHEGLEAIAVEAACRLVDGQLKRKKADPSFQNKMLEETLPGRKVLFQQARATVMAQSGGHYPAPLAILDVVETGLFKGFEKGLEAESKRFGELSQTTVSKGLISIFFGQTELKKNRFGQPETEARNLAVLGAGLMGAGIGLVSIEKKFNVILKDVGQESLTRGTKTIWDEINRKVKRKAITAFQREQVMSRLTSQLDMRNFEKCDVVIEAVFEDLELKRRVIREVEERISDKCIFASNTSALPIGEIAKASKRPENVVGMHYFSPVHKMPLLEVITTKQTSKEASAIAVDVGIRQGKTVIVVGDGPGFYTTRILAPFMDEVGVLALEGADFYQLDQAMLEEGFFVGPIALIDEVGIDVAAHVGRDMSKAFGARITGSDPKGFEEFVAKGFLGRKSGKGFYLYTRDAKQNPVEKVKLAIDQVVTSVTKKKKPKPVNPEALAIIKKQAGGKSRKIEKSEIQERVLYRMLNEASFCLQEGILQNPVDGDIGAVFGLGFPPFKGGPFRYMDQLGAQTLVSKLKQYADKHGVRFEPSALLQDYAKQNKKFYS
ncbi:MAG: enoyl-CoA hydratase/isomerase family protein [SAR324 cluster bacterium]|nr:enoyl-CoA hydratase/isomerase family protein [SAR324 cluster bacterium]